MLRRTRAAQVGPVFEAFVAKYPSISTLAEASLQDVARLLQPLGLEWRVPAFTAMARRVQVDYGGRIPTNREELLSLPGVGDYVADAVRCFAYGESTAVVDTNTVRVAGRYLGFPTGPDSRRNRQVQEAVASLVDRTAPIDSNLALLDLAATICTARAPKCDVCPVSGQCVWFAASPALAVRQTAVKGRR